MEDYDTPDPELIKGFNEGYTIAKHLPDLSNQVGEVTGESPRMLGFRQGREQFAAEQKQDRYPTWLKNDRLYKSAFAPDDTKGRDREPER